MKRILTPIILLTFLGCVEQQTTIVQSQKMIEADKMLEKSKIGLDTALVIQHKSDLATKSIVNNIINKVNSYRLKSLVVKRDTVFIETKKNFWGKTKTNVRVSSDSNTTEIVDTLNNK
jgi:hypothetical protein